MHQSDFMKGKHDISKMKNMKKLQVSLPTQQQDEAIQSNVIIMHTYLFWIYNAQCTLKSIKIPKSMPITGPSIFVSAAVTRTEADTTDTSKSKANRFDMAKQLVTKCAIEFPHRMMQLSQSWTKNGYWRWWCSSKTSPKAKVNLQSTSSCKTIIRQRSHESLAARCITMPKPVITFDYIVHFARPGSVAPHSICHSLQRWSLWPGLTVDPKKSWRKLSMAKKPGCTPNNWTWVIGNGLSVCLSLSIYIYIIVYIYIYT